MSGQDLLYGLSFVDDRFIAEADMADMRRKNPWMKVLSVAACVCILIAGAFALENMGYQGALEEAAPAAAVPEAMAEAAPKEEVSEEEPILPYPVEEESASGELQHIPYAKLRVIDTLEDGSFEAFVEEAQEMASATRVTVIVDPSKVPGQTAEITPDLSDLVEDAVFTIEDGAYDAGLNILYVADIFLAQD